MQAAFTWWGVLAVGAGAMAGAWLRWGLTVFNDPAQRIPWGTFLANAIGAYLIGWALAWFNAHPELSPTWRLALITGFLGALTTFSTFSAEVIGLIERGQWSWAGLLACLHLAGSLTLTALGIVSFRWWAN